MDNAADVIVDISLRAIRGPPAALSAAQSRSDIVIISNVSSLLQQQQQGAAAAATMGKFAAGDSLGDGRLDSRSPVHKVDSVTDAIVCLFTRAPHCVPNSN
jgi:hypothetical protein